MASTDDNFGSIKTIRQFNSTPAANLQTRGFREDTSGIAYGSQMIQHELDKQKQIDEIKADKELATQKQMQDDVNTNQLYSNLEKARYKLLNINTDSNGNIIDSNGNVITDPSEMLAQKRKQLRNLYLQAADTARQYGISSVGTKLLEKGDKDINADTDSLTKQVAMDFLTQNMKQALNSSSSNPNGTFANSNGIGSGISKDNAQEVQKSLVDAASNIKDPKLKATYLATVAGYMNKYSTQVNQEQQQKNRDYKLSQDIAERNRQSNVNKSVDSTINKINMYDKNDNLLTEDEFINRFAKQYNGPVTNYIENLARSFYKSKLQSANANTNSIAQQELNETTTGDIPPTVSLNDKKFVSTDSNGNFNVNTKEINNNIKELNYQTKSLTKITHNPTAFESLGNYNSYGTGDKSTFTYMNMNSKYSDVNPLKILSANPDLRAKYKITDKDIDILRTLKRSVDSNGNIQLIDVNEKLSQKLIKYYDDIKNGNVNNIINTNKQYIKHLQDIGHLKSASIKINKLATDETRLGRIKDGYKYAANKIINDNYQTFLNRNIPVENAQKYLESKHVDQGVISEVTQILHQRDKLLQQVKDLYITGTKMKYDKSTGLPYIDLKFNDNTNVKNFVTGVLSNSGSLDKSIKVPKWALIKIKSQLAREGYAINSSIRLTPKNYNQITSKILKIYSDIMKKEDNE